MNPTPQAEESQQEEIETVQERISPSQLRFDIVDKRTQANQLVSGIKHALKKRRDIVEISPIWKSAALPFAIVSSIANILILFIGGILNFDRFGPQVRVFYDAINQVPVTVDKIFTFIIPILLTIFFVIQIRLISKIFKQDRNLAKTIAWTITFLNILFMLAVDQIYSLALA